MSRKLFRAESTAKNDFDDGGSGDQSTPNLAQPRVQKRMVLATQSSLLEANERTEANVKLVKSIRENVTALMDTLYQVQYGHDMSSITSSVSALSLSNTPNVNVGKQSEVKVIASPLPNTKTPAATKKPTKIRR